MAKIKEHLRPFPEKPLLVLIFFLALILRLFAIFHLPGPHQIPINDAESYDKLGAGLAEGKGYIDSNTGTPTSFRVPLYPLFLASIYLVFGHNYAAVRIVQSILGALLCIIIFYIARRIFDKKIALLASGILAFYQPYIYYLFYGGPGFLLSENLFAFLLAVLTLFLSKSFFVDTNLKNGFISGILLGLVTLTRPATALFPIAIFILLKYKYSFVTSGRKILPLLIAFVLMLLPWVVRNFYAHRAFIPFCTEGGVSLLAGNNPQAKGGAVVAVDNFLTEEEKNKINSISEVQRDEIYRSHAKEFLIKNYKKLPGLFIRKLFVFWDVFGTDYDLGLGRRYNVWYATMLMFGMLGIFVSLKSKPNLGIWVLLSLFLYFSIITMIFAGCPRFRYPLEPYLIIFSSTGVFAIYQRLKNRLFSTIIIFIIIGLNLLLYKYDDKLLNLIRHLLR